MIEKVNIFGSPDKKDVVKVTDMYSTKSEKKKKICTNYNDFTNNYRLLNFFSLYRKNPYNVCISRAEIAWVVTDKGKNPQDFNNVMLMDTVMGEKYINLAKAYRYKNVKKT